MGNTGNTPKFGSCRNSILSVSVPRNHELGIKCSRGCSVFYVTSCLASYLQKSVEPPTTYIHPASGVTQNTCPICINCARYTHVRCTILHICYFEVYITVPQQSQFCPTSPTVTSRGYHAAPADAARLAVSRSEGPQAVDTPELHPAPTAASRGTTTADEGRRELEEEEESTVPESGGWTEKAFVSRSHVCPVVLWYTVEACVRTERK